MFPSKQANMRLYLLLSILGCFISTSFFAQNILPIGQWRSHLPYRTAPYVAQSEEKVYFATAWSVAEIDKTDRAVRLLSKVEGLSNTGISLIKYNQGSEILMIIYDNSIIDLVKPDEIVTLNQIANFTNIVGDKIIYDAFVANDSTIYLAANYGISKVNILRDEFAFSTITGIEVTGITVFENNIYVATPEGVYRISEDNFFPEDFSNWELLGGENGFPEDYSSRKVVGFNGALYTDINNSIFKLSGGSTTSIYSAGTGLEMAYMTAEGDRLLAGWKCTSGCSSSLAIHIDQADQAQAFPDISCTGVPNYAIQDKEGRIYFGDDNQTFRILNSINDQDCEQFVLNSPRNANVYSMTVFNDTLYVAAGGVTPQFSPVFSPSGFYKFGNGQWEIVNRETNETMKGVDPNDADDDIRDVLAVAVRPDNSTIYAGSYYEGLVELAGDKGQIYNEMNSTLANVDGSNNRVRVSGLAFDQDNNLWVANYLAINDRPISVLKADGTWQNFGLSCDAQQIHQADIDASGYKWFVTRSDQAGVIVFDSGDLDDPTDNRCKAFTTNNSEMPTNAVNCLVVDLDGDVWVGTEKGVIIFECGASVFEPECVGSLRRVEQDGFGAFLLATENVRTIAIDGANRKWVGSDNGIFLLSPDGNDQIARFTEENSPLFDNTVLEIIVNQNSGEVFIGTEKGILSYQSDAIAGTNRNSSNVLVYPNPVQADYEGPIAIRGLARDANVKITDISGKLVFETQALGGQAVWDARDYTGRRVNSGVYLIFSTSDARFSGLDDPDAIVAKVVVLN